MKPAVVFTVLLFIARFIYDWGIRQQPSGVRVFRSRFNVDDFTLMRTLKIFFLNAFSTECDLQPVAAFTRR